MDTLTAALRVIVARAADATREQLAELEAQRRTLAAAGRVALDLDAISSEGLAEIGPAQAQAEKAINRRQSDIGRMHLAAIERVPADRRSRGTLISAPTPTHVASRLDVIVGQVPHLVREIGLPLHLLVDGGAVGAVEAYDFTTSGDHFRIGELGSWPKARVVAVSIEEDDDHFGVLLDDGTLLEIQEDVDFVHPLVATMEKRA